MKAPITLLSVLLAAALAAGPSAAKLRPPALTPEGLAQMCIKQGCWMPTVTGVTHVYACAGGETVRTHFDTATNRLQLQRGEAAAVAMTEQRDPPGSRDFRFVGMDLVWTPTEGVAGLASASAPQAAARCALTRIEQGDPPSILTVH